MKISIAQIRPFKGDIDRNIGLHLQLIEKAVAKEADVIVFPELSLTAYEPELAEALAMALHDQRLDVLQEISDRAHILIGVGAPIKVDAGVCIGMVLFEPGRHRQVYTKRYLHPDEEPYFSPGRNLFNVIGHDPRIAPAICYELSVPEHAEAAFQSGAKVYLASVAKSAGGMEKAGERLSEIAKKYNMTVLLSNSVGYCDNFESAGKSAIWNAQGKLIAQLDETETGILITDK